LFSLSITFTIKNPDEKVVKNREELNLSQFMSDMFDESIKSKFVQGTMIIIIMEISVSR
jgi:activator of HSP90 ATPase